MSFKEYFRKFYRHPAVSNTLGALIALYIRLVQHTTRWTLEPADQREALKGEQPFIIGMWHGQHIIAPAAWPKGWRGSALVARHADGELNAIALRRLGWGVVSGSGANAKGRTGKSVARRGGVQALIAMLRTLEGGSSVALTADVPKIGGIAGQGIVKLAAMSGRPIYCFAIATRRGLHFDTWDNATLPLPFGRGAIIVSERLDVAKDASEAELEEARREVTRRLDRAHQRAYELAGGAPWKIRHGE